MTRKVPLSTESLMNIGGIGEQKVKEHGKHIVNTIWSFLQKNNLLHLFSDYELSEEHPPYDIPDCPTWRDPMSAEAEAIRAANVGNAQSSPMKSSSDHNKPHQVSPYAQYSPQGSMISSSAQPLFQSPQKSETPAQTGMYTYHSRPGVAANLVQAVTPPSALGSMSREEHPYARYLNQRDGGSKVTPQKRPSPSDSSRDENDPIRRRIPIPDFSSHIADPTNFLVSPDN